MLQLLIAESFHQDIDINLVGSDEDTFQSNRSLLSQDVIKDRMSTTTWHLRGQKDKDSSSKISVAKGWDQDLAAIVILVLFLLGRYDELVASFDEFAQLRTR